MVPDMQQILGFAETIVIGNKAENSGILDTKRDSQIIVVWFGSANNGASMDDTKAFAGKRRNTLIIVENLPTPFDRRVWQGRAPFETPDTGLGHLSVGKGYERYECLDRIHVYRHQLPLEARGTLGVPWSTPRRCSGSSSWLEVLFRHGFDVIHACNRRTRFSDRRVLSCLENGSCLTTTISIGAV
jgi:hypothetical protein